MKNHQLKNSDEAAEMCFEPESAVDLYVQQRFNVMLKP
jgi:hypothetical protein